MEDLIIGSHVGYKKDTGLVGSVEEALSYNANTFMFYTGAPQNTMRLPINEEQVNKAKALMQENNIDINNVIVHAPYIINLANSEKNYDFSINFLKEELKRVEKLGMKYLVLHPGSHVGLGIDKGIQNIIFALNKSLESTDNVIICLETMAGKGSEVGSNFYELKDIINGIIKRNQIMVCLDTCHINDAGYDENNFDNILEEFDNVIGLEKLACIHINDSKNDLGTHKDRHANIGCGTIGFNNLLNIIYHDKLKGIPKILETPYITSSNSKESYPPYKEEIKMIRNKKMNDNLIQDILNSYK